MKIFLITLLLLCTVSSSFAVGDYSTGDYLYNWAISGLNMRTKPDAKSSKIINISFGEKVKIVDDQPYSYPFRYTMVKSKNPDSTVQWEIDGHWVKVEYLDQVGYVFDGYLSKLPVMTNAPEHNPYLSLELIKEYGEKNWGGLSEETTINTLNFEDKSRDPDKGHSSSYTLTFKNGAYYEDVEESFSGYVTLFVKDISLEEAYLIFNALTGFEYKLKVNGERENYGMGAHLTSQKEDELHFIGAGMTSINIKKVDGGVIIQLGGGC